jgi:hypothetical protein
MCQKRCPVSGRTPGGRKRLRRCDGCGKRTTAQTCDACLGRSGTRLVWADVLEHGAEIARSYGSPPPTLRQLFYRLVADGTLPNLDNYYRRLAGQTAAGRRAGTFPRLTDESSQIIRYETFSDPDDARAYLREIYRRDRTEGQPYTIYLAVEKKALAGLLDAWFAGPLGIPLYPLGGYAKEERCEEIARDVEAQGRPAVLITAGDFDPSGMHITADFVKRTACWDKVVRVALDWQQVQDHDLPENADPAVAAKLERDPRAKEFEREHGFLKQFELDALPPDVLRAMYQSAIDRYWDSGAYRAVMEQEQADLAELEGGEKSGDLHPHRARREAAPYPPRCPLVGRPEGCPAPLGRWRHGREPRSWPGQRVPAGPPTPPPLTR